MRCLVIGEVMLCVCDWRNWESLSNTYSCLHEKISQQGREARGQVEGQRLVLLLCRSDLCCRN